MLNVFEAEASYLVGARGPRTAPTALKMVKGERKDRINIAEPVPSTGEVEPPKWLEDEALEVWNVYAPDLEAKQVLTAWDVEEFATWCSWAATHRQSVRDIRRLGELIELPIVIRGEMVGEKVERNPACITRREASDQMLRYGARFGLTPSDRTAIKVDAGHTKGNKARLLTS